ncbi:MAG TPA: hypothetical protein VNF29_02190 [Candidatus Binataceae bacterium]|nr:hypothetical protein [Candidatus Binataceae bacterium]
MPEFKTGLCESVADHVVRITQNRPEVRIAQNSQLTYAPNAVVDAAGRAR